MTRTARQELAKLIKDFRRMVRSDKDTSPNKYTFCRFRGWAQALTFFCYSLDEYRLADRLHKMIREREKHYDW